MRLNLKQTQAIDYLEDKKTIEVNFGGGAGGGKSILGCYWLIKNSFKYDGSRWLMGRSKLKTLKETTLQSFFKVCAMQNIREGAHYRYNGSSSKENPNSIEFKNKSVILLRDLFYYPSDPNFDELGSLEITGAFVDETSQIVEKAWTIVGSRIRHNVDNYGLIPKMLGTCNPTKNFVYNRFYKPWRDGTLPDEKKFIQSLVTDNPDIDKFYYDNLMRLDTASRERLLRGNWEYDDDPSVLMQYEKIVDLFTNVFVLGGQKYITCDVARLGKDKTKIRVWDGFRSIKKVTIDVCRTTEIVDKIRQLQREYSVPNSNTIVDEDGVGGGVVDMLRCVGFINNSRQIEQHNQNLNYSNLKSQCYFALADYVNQNKIFLANESIQDRELIVQELEQIKQRSMDNDLKLSVNSKDEIKQSIGRSPDEADCLMMRMWFTLKTVRQSCKLDL